MYNVKSGVCCRLNTAIKTKAVQCMFSSRCSCKIIIMISKQAYHSAENPTHLSCNRSADDIEVVPEREGSFG